MKQHVHRRQPCRAIYQLDSADAPGGEPVPLLGRQVAAVVTLDVVVRRKQEAARAARWVADRVVRTRLDAVDHRGDQLTGCEVLSSPGLDVLGRPGWTTAPCRSNRRSAS